MSAGAWYVLPSTLNQTHTLRARWVKSEDP
jgi:hypothetical protein